MDNKKRVFFIGGTAFAGSTLVDLILSNSGEGISVGEQSALFFPYKDHHYHYDWNHPPDVGIFWKEMKQKGYDNVFRNIFSTFPEKKYIVDSSKDLYWIYLQNKLLAKEEIDVVNILLWRKPESFAKSYLKRGKDNWQKDWVNYYRYYLTLVDDPVRIDFEKFISNKEYLKQICNELKISYHDEICDYWKNKSYTLFGNWSAKISLYDKDSEVYNKAKKILENTNKNTNKINYRRLHIDKTDSAKTKPKQIQFENTMVSQIENILQGNQKKSKQILVTRFQLIIKLYKFKMRFILYQIKHFFKLFMSGSREYAK